MSLHTGRACDLSAAFCLSRPVWSLLFSKLVIACLESHWCLHGTVILNTIWLEILSKISGIEIMGKQLSHIVKGYFLEAMNFHEVFPRLDFLKTRQTS